MKRETLFFIAFQMLFTYSLTAQVMGNFQYRTQQVFRQAEVQQTDRRPVTNPRIAHNHEMTITVHGLANLIATDYVAVFNVVQVASGMREALELMNTRLETFRSHLPGSDISPADIHVDLISFVPRYDVRRERKLFSTTFNEIPDGFELQQNVSVRYRNSGVLPAIMAAAAEAEIYDIVKVDYFVDNIDLWIDSIRTGCIAQVVAREKGLSGLGLRIDTLRKVVAEDFTTIYPPTRYFSYQAFARPSMSAALSGNRRRQTQDTLLVEVDKTVSRFYQQVHYDNYDLVSKPVIQEPVIQISFSLTVKYFLKEEAVPPGNRYFIVTPSGDLKQIDPR